MENYDEQIFRILKVDNQFEESIVICLISQGNYLLQMERTWKALNKREQELFDERKTEKNGSLSLVYVPLLRIPF